MDQSAETSSFETQGVDVKAPTVVLEFLDDFGGVRVLGFMVEECIPGFAGDLQARASDHLGSCQNYGPFWGTLIGAVV